MNDERRVIAVTIEVSDQYCKDILVTCVEGGSNYWATFRNVIRDKELDILECEVLDREESEIWKKIRVEDIRRAVSLVMKPEFKVHQSYKTMIASDDNDALSSDIILQAAMFGEVIYG